MRPGASRGRARYSAGMTAVGLPILVQCPTHGLVVNSDAVIHEGGSARVIFQYNSVNCPYCGVVSPAINAEYYRDGFGVWRAIYNASREQLESIGMAVRGAKTALRSNGDQKAAAELLEKEIVNAAPDVKPILEALKGSGSMAIATWLSVLLSMAMFFLAIHTADSGVSSDELERILDETVRAVHSGQSHTGPAVPSTSGEVPPPEVPPPTVTELPTPDTR